MSQPSQRIHVQLYVDTLTVPKRTSSTWKLQLLQESRREVAEDGRLASRATIEAIGAIVATREKAEARVSAAEAWWQQKVEALGLNLHRLQVYNRIPRPHNRKSTSRLGNCGVGVVTAEGICVRTRTARGGSSQSFCTGCAFTGWGLRIR